MLKPGWRKPKAILAAEEGGARQWNVTLGDSCQGVHWHSVPAKDAHIAHPPSLAFSPSAPPLSP